MATISIARKHKLTHKKAKTVAEKIAKDLNKRFGLDYAWKGDRIEFERPGVTGHMSVGKDKIVARRQPRVAPDAAQARDRARDHTRSSTSCSATA